jgi:hypothetical protein
VQLHPQEEFLPRGQGPKDRGQDATLIGHGKPLLIYPIDQLDAEPRRKSGFGRLRALVTISIFKLSDPIARRTLSQGRARAIQNLYFNLRAIQEDSDPVIVPAARKNVARMLRPDEPFANCLRSFHRLCQDSPDEARQIFDDLTEFLDKNSP